MGKINDLKDAALATLKGKWGSFVGLTFIYFLLEFLASGISQFGTTFSGSSFSTLATFFIGAGFLVTLLLLPLSVGYAVACLNASRQDLPAEIGDLFIGYKNFWHVLGTLLLMTLAVLAGFICLIIPGIILALAYGLVPYVLHDNPELSAVETLKKSRMMMDGHKWELFLLELSFIGWLLLGILTLFIGYLWLVPYMQMTVTKFYEKIRSEYEATNTEDVAPDTIEDVEIV